MSVCFRVAPTPWPVAQLFEMGRLSLLLPSLNDAKDEDDVVGVIHNPAAVASVYVRSEVAVDQNVNFARCA